MNGLRLPCGSWSAAVDRIVYNWRPATRAVERPPAPRLERARESTRCPPTSSSTNAMLDAVADGEADVRGRSSSGERAADQLERYGPGRAAIRGCVTRSE